MGPDWLNVQSNYYVMAKTSLKVKVGSFCMARSLDTLEYRKVRPHTIWGEGRSKLYM